MKVSGSYLHDCVCWLIFFTVAGMGLCFGFVVKTVLIIEGCFHYCWAVLTQCQGLFCFWHHPTSE